MEIDASETLLILYAANYFFFLCEYINREAIHVPFMAKFVVFAKRVEPLEARLRVFCMTDDKEDKTLEFQEHFTEVAKSRDVEVLEGKPQYTEFAGNLVPVTKSGEQLQIPFKAFRENRLPFNVRVKDLHADTVGRALFMREPRVAKGEQPQQPICILNIVLPEKILAENSADEYRETKYLAEFQNLYKSAGDRSNLSDIRIVDISNSLGEDWIRLAPELGITEQEINDIIVENPTSTPRQAQSMLQNYILRKDNNRTVLETGLRSIKRDDIIKTCLRLGVASERPNQLPTNVARRSLEQYEESDIMKDSESVEELTAKIREHDESKYSAEEKIVEDSDGESQGDETVERSVAERRERIVKRLSIERPIPASSQQKEIKEEVAEVKRRSLIEDKKALHEEEIIMHAPTDNIIKSTTIPDQIVKLKSTINDDIDVSKSDFDKELDHKLKATLKDVDSFEHQVVDEASNEMDDKIRFDSAATEKPFKMEDIGAAIDEITATKQFLEQETAFQPAHDTQKAIAPTTDFHIVEQVSAQSIPATTVTTTSIEKKNGHGPNETTITETKTTVTVRQPSTDDENNISSVTKTTVQISKDIFHGDDTDSDKLYKTIEEKITKKMSQDFSAFPDHIISDGMSSDCKFSSQKEHRLIYY